jgi:hypothetical protein
VRRRRLEPARGLRVNAQCGEVHERVAGLILDRSLIWGAQTLEILMDVDEFGADRAEHGVADRVAAAGKVVARRRNEVIVDVVEGLGVLGVISIAGLAIGAVDGA